MSGAQPLTSPAAREELRRPEAHLDRWGPWIALALLTAAFSVTFTWLSLARHAAFQSHAFDLGNMDQAVWNTLHGHLLRFTDMDVGGTVLTSRLAIHVEPLLAALAPLYAIHAGPETLLVCQAIVVGSGAIPMYLLAREALERNWLGLVFPVAYLLHPSLQNAVLDDFHAVTMSACFLSWTIYFAWRGRAVPFAAAGLTSAATKEEVSLLVGLCGLLFLWPHMRSWVAMWSRQEVSLLQAEPAPTAVREVWAPDRHLGRAALAMVGALVAGIVWFLICVLGIIPSFNPSGHSPYLERYSYLGHGVRGILAGAVSHPGRVGHVLTSAPRLYYLADLLRPLGFVSLLAFPVVLLAMPALLINMLSADPTMYSGFYQYSAEVVPFVVAAAALGTAGASGLGRRLHVLGASRLAPFLCGLVLVASTVDSWKYGFSPLAQGYLLPSAGTHQRLEVSILGKVPRDVPVAAADEIEPHLAERRWAYLMPTMHPANGPVARYLLLDASVPSEPVEPHTLHNVVLRALRQGYGVSAADDGILLLRQGARSKRLPAEFYSFAFRPLSHANRSDVRWGSLRLRAFVVHPRLGLVNRSRPAIGVETEWRAIRRLPPNARVVFYLSPVYDGAQPAFSQLWQRDTDTPTTTWLPMRFWPRQRDIAVASLPLLPHAGDTGKVDVAVAVTGLGPAIGAAHGLRIAGNEHAIRLGTITVER